MTAGTKFGLPSVPLLNSPNFWDTPLLELIIDSLPGKAPQEKPEVIKEMRRRIRQTFDGEAPRVLDPFAGGGSLPLEAARLGCETYAQDLNPNAVLTLLRFLAHPCSGPDQEPGVVPRYLFPRWVICRSGEICPFRAN